MAKARLKGLDGIRGVLAIGVAYSHTFGHVTGWNSGLSFVKDASFAVDVFFILSGIVLIESYYDRFGGSARGWINFLIVRVMRLYPLYLVTSAFVVFGCCGTAAFRPGLRRRPFTTS